MFDRSLTDPLHNSRKSLRGFILQRFGNLQINRTSTQTIHKSNKSVQQNRCICAERDFERFGDTVAKFLLSYLILSSQIRSWLISANRTKARKCHGVFGSMIGAVAGACSCGPIGFAVISTFGAAGGVATSFLTNYEIPIRFLAIAILVFTYYTTAKSLKVECKISG